MPTYKRKPPTFEAVVNDAALRTAIMADNHAVLPDWMEPHVHSGHITADATAAYLHPEGGGTAIEIPDGDFLSDGGAYLRRWPAASFNAQFEEV